MNEEKLSDLPNIGKELEKRLLEVGIRNPDELRKVGSQWAFLRLNLEDPGACFNMLCALEGAIQNIRWHHLDKATKDELKHFLNVLRLKGSKL